jgi:hypothetical protein
MTCGGAANPGVAGQMDWDEFNFAGILSAYVQRHVVDRTGLSGKFDVQVNWAYVTTPLTGDTPVPEGPSLFAALEEQLGLKLEAATEPVEVLVIDAVASRHPIDGRPSEELTGELSTSDRKKPCLRHRLPCAPRRFGSFRWKWE